MARLVVKPRGSTIELGADIRPPAAQCRQPARSSRGRRCATPPVPEALDGRLPGAGAPRGSAGLDLPLRPDHRAAAGSAAGAARRVGDGRARRDGDVRPAEHDDLAAARGLVRHPLRRGLHRFRVRCHPRRFDRDHHRPTPPCPAPKRRPPSRSRATPHVAPVRLILRVGAAPSTLPQGGSVTQQCSQAAGASCTISVIGAVGEVNPLPRTPLSVIEVRATGACVGVTFARRRPERCSPRGRPTRRARPARRRSRCRMRRDADRTPSATAAPARPAGFPEAPASVAQTSFADGSLTLRVDPGEARLAYPALTGFVIRSDGADVAQCAARRHVPGHRGPERRAAHVRGVRRQRRRRVRSGVSTIAWAYDSPAGPRGVEGAPSSPTARAGSCSLVVDGIDAAETGTSRSRAPPVRPSGCRCAGQTRVEVPSTVSGRTPRPRSRSRRTPASTCRRASAAARRRGADDLGQRHRRAGQPGADPTSASNGDGTSTVTARGCAHRRRRSPLRYGIVREGRACSTAAGGATATFTGPATVRSTRSPCARSRGSTGFVRCDTTTATVRAAQEDTAPRGYTFVVDPPPPLGAACGMGDPGRPAVRRAGAQPQPRRVRRTAERDLRSRPRRAGALRARALGHRDAVVGRHSASRQRPVPGAGALARAVLRRRSDLVPAGDSSTDAAGGKAAITFGNASLRYYDDAGAQLPHTADTWAVPVGGRARRRHHRVGLLERRRAGGSRPPPRPSPQPATRIPPPPAP